MKKGNDLEKAVENLKLADIFPRVMNIWAHESHQPVITDYGVMRIYHDGYTPYSTIDVDFMFYVGSDIVDRADFGDDEKEIRIGSFWGEYFKKRPQLDAEEPLTVAHAKIKLMSVDDGEGVAYKADEEGGFANTAAACDMYLEWLEEKKPTVYAYLSWGFYYCEVYNMYISPDFRGLGLGNYIWASIPYILRKLRVNPFVVVTHINPFVNQNLDLSVDRCGGTYMKHDGVVEDNVRYKELVNIMKKPLVKLGYRKTPHEEIYCMDSVSYFKKMESSRYSFDDVGIDWE